MTPLDRAVNPRVREFLLSYGGRTTRIGGHGKRVLCSRQETLAQLALDDYYPRSAAFGKFLFEDHVDASSESFAQMRTELQKLHLLHYSENTGGALVSGFPNPWHKPTQAPVHEDPLGPSYPKSSKDTGAADLGCSPMS